MHDVKARDASGYADDPARTAPDAFTFADVRRFFRRRRFAIAVPILLALAAAFGFNRLAIPMYNARAQVIIDPRLPQFIPGHNDESVLAWDTAQVESEIAVIASERIAGAVVTKLSLDKSNDFRNAPSWSERLLAVIQRRDPVSQLDPDRFRMALGLIETGLSVRRTGLSYAIDINFTYPDPLRAEEIANGLAEAYIADQLENRSQAARVGGDWLQQRMVLLRSQMNAAAKAVQIFRASHNYQIPKAAEAGGGPPAPEEQTLDELEAAAATYRRIFESFLQSYTESVQRQSFPVSDARLLTKASLPKTRSSPRTTLVFALALMIGTLVGFGLAVLLEHLDRTIRTLRQAQEVTGLPAFGTVPRFRRRWVPSLLLSGLQRRRHGACAQVVRGIHREIRHRGAWWRSSRARWRHLAVMDRPDDDFGQAVRTVTILTDLALEQQNIRCLGLAAAHRGAGSSSLASNIALLNAAHGRKTLLVDADFKGRTLSKALHLTAAAGLSDMLAGAVTPDEAIVALGNGFLDVLPTGSQGGEWCGPWRGTELRDGLGELAPRYALIVIDLPPLLPVSEGLVMASSLDGLLLVVRAGKTTTTMLNNVQSWLSQARALVAGFVLTHVPR